MNEQNQQIGSLVSEMRVLLEEIALLLQTADAEMREHGWVSRTGNSATSGNTASIQYPRYWLPGYLYRFYESEEPRYRHVLPFLAVLLDNREQNPQFNVTQPLVTAGWFTFGMGSEVGNPNEGWHYWYCTYHGFMPMGGASNDGERLDDGTLYTVRREDTPQRGESGHSFRSATTFGYPLASVTDAESLSVDVIKPLLRGIQQAVT